MIARPAKGTQTVSRNGPSLPIKSSSSLFQPLNSMNGLFQRASAVIKGTSTGIASRETKTQLGSFDNLRHSTKMKIWYSVIHSLRRMPWKREFGYHSLHFHWFLVWIHFLRKLVHVRKVRVEAKVCKIPYYCAAPFKSGNTTILIILSTIIFGM